MAAHAAPVTSQQTIGRDLPLLATWLSTLPSRAKLDVMAYRIDSIGLVGQNSKETAVEFVDRLRDVKTSPGSTRYSDYGDHDHHHSVVESSLFYRRNA
jgi:hypothetical protein